MSAKVKTHDQRKKAHRPKGPWLNRVFIGMLTFCFGLLTFIFEGFVLRDIETIRQPDWETYRSQRSDQSLSELQVRSSELGRQLADLDRQIKQYREAYERFLCPVCEYPIRTGLRRFLYWTRRTVHKTIPAQASSGQPLQDEPYSCPSCGTTLFEDCRQCGHSRHSLLPHCSHCGEGSEDEVVKHDLKGTET